MDREFLTGLGIAEETIDGILAEHNKALGAVGTATQTVQSQTQPQVQMPQAKSFEGVSQEDYDKVVAELEQLRANGMTDEERVQAEIAKAQKAEAKYKLEMSKLQVAKIFVEAGLTEEEYAPLRDSVATADEKLSIALANQIAGALKSKTEATEKSVREQMMKDTPEVPGGEPTDGEGELSLGAQMAQAYCAE